MRTIPHPQKVKPTFAQEEFQRTLQLAESSGKLTGREKEGLLLEYLFHIVVKSFGISYDWSKHCKQWKKTRGHVADFTLGSYWIEIKNWKDRWRSKTTITSEIVSRFLKRGVRKILLTTDRKTNPRRLKYYYAIDAIILSLGKVNEENAQRALEELANNRRIREILFSVLLEPYSFYYSLYLLPLIQAGECREQYGCLHRDSTGIPP